MLGFAAGSLTTFAYVPQAIKIWKTRSTKDLSLGMLATVSAGIFLWLIYGVLIGSVPVVLANGASFVITSIVLLLKIRFG